MSVQRLDEVKEIVINALSSVLATDPDLLTVSIKKYSRTHDQTYSITGVYRKTEFLSEDSGTFNIELTKDLEIESLEVY